MSRRCRRRLARALSAAWSVLFSATRAALFKCCQSRLQEGTGAGGGGGGGACALDLLRSLPVRRSCSAAGGGSAGGGDELAVASLAFARSAVTNGLRSVPAGLAAARGGGSEAAKLWQAEQNLAAAAMFLAAWADDPALDNNVGGGGGGGGRRRGNGGRSEFWAHSGAAEAARQAGEKLGSAVSPGLSSHALAAIARQASGLACTVFVGPRTSVCWFVRQSGLRVVQGAQGLSVTSMP